MNQLVMDRTARRTASPARRAQDRAATAPGRSSAPAPVAGGRSAVRPRPHERRTLAAVSLGVLAVLLVATWSFAQGWGRGPVVGPGELAVDGGVVRVDGVVSAARPQHAMPGMGADEDPVADGFRRVSVDVTLMAGAGTMEYAADAFGLTVDGEPADRLAHRDVLPGEMLPAGTRLSGTVLFDVPVDATEATLTYDGAGSTDIVLPSEEEQTAGGAPVEHPMTGAGHGADGHPGGATPLEGTAPEDPAAAGR